MKITIDTSCLVINPDSGLSEVVHNLLLHLPIVDTSAQFFLYMNFFRAPDGTRNITYPGTTSYTCRAPRRLTALWWRFDLLPIDFCLRDSDVYHSLHIQVPPTRKIKSILTVHDCRYLAHPELYSLRDIREYWRQMKISLDRVELVIAVSDFTREEVINHFSFPEDRIRTIHNGFTKLVPQAACSEEKINRFLDSHNIPRNYLLYAGVLDPRKNLTRFMEALKQCRKESSHFPDLVIAGVTIAEWRRSYEAKKAVELGLKDHIHLTGKVKKESLTGLMKKAHALCYPSLYEGFGFPPLEAMSVGVPVLAANSASIPEVVGPAACLVDPRSVEDIYRGMLRIVTDSNYRRELVQTGYEQVDKFSWSKAAREYIRAYKEILS